MKEKLKVFVAMSGGVDSSVAAALLKKDGYQVTGVHMRCYNVDGCAEQDAEDARRAAEVLDIPFYVFDFEKEYKVAVVDYMVDGYRKGITPNPDVMCNKEIKFGLFLKKALAMSADYVATGHYVRLLERPARYFYGNQNKFFPAKNFSSPSLRRTLAAGNQAVGAAGRSLRNSGQASYSFLAAEDKNKDQSYFLWTLTQEQLKHCLFPIGDYKKPEVRRLATKFGLLNAAKKDSQGICFLGQVSLPDFLQRYIKPKKGPIVIASGAKQPYKIIGQHNGAHFYTIGQRSGLKIGGFKKPLYVVEKDVRKNIVVVAEGDDHPALYKKEIMLTGVNFISSKLKIKNLKLKIPVYVRVRYRQPLEKAQLSYYPNSRELENRPQLKLFFDKPMKFVAEGQSAVFYNKKGEMLGGGVIKSVK